MCPQVKFFSQHLAKDDGQSVDMLVAKLREEIYDPIVMYKPQGHTSADFPGLQEDNFCLVIQTEFQRDMMVDHGKRVVCMDGTHGLTGIDFPLLTIMVPDEFHNGETAVHDSVGNENENPYSQN